MATPVAPSHAHVHDHAPHEHPAQLLPWSLLRMGVPARLAIAIGLSVCLWLMVWTVL